MQGVSSWSVIGIKFSLWNVIYNLLSSWTVKRYIFVMRYFIYIFFVMRYFIYIFYVNCDLHTIFLVKFVTKIYNLRRQQIVSFCIVRHGIDINNKCLNFHSIDGAFILIWPVSSVVNRLSMQDGKLDRIRLCYYY